MAPDLACDPGLSMKEPEVLFNLWRRDLHSCNASAQAAVYELQFYQGGVSSADADWVHGINPWLTQRDANGCLHFAQGWISDAFLTHVSQVMQTSISADLRLANDGREQKHSPTAQSLISIPRAQSIMKVDSQMRVSASVGTAARFETKGECSLIRLWS